MGKRMQAKMHEISGCAVRWSTFVKLDLEVQPRALDGDERDEMQGLASQAVPSDDWQGRDVAVRAAYVSASIQNFDFRCKERWYDRVLGC